MSFLWWMGASPPDPRQGTFFPQVEGYAEGGLRAASESCQARQATGAAPDAAEGLVVLAGPCGQRVVNACTLGAYQRERLRRGERGGVERRQRGNGAGHGGGGRPGAAGVDRLGRWGVWRWLVLMWMFRAWVVFARLPPFVVMVVGAVATLDGVAAP